MPLKNSQYNAIMRQYDLRRQEAVNALRERQKHITLRIPDFAVLDAKIAGTAAAHARALIQGDSSGNIHEKIDLLEQKKKDLLQKNGYPDNYLELIYQCQDCKDTGYIGDEKCHCFKQAVVDLVYAQSNIKERLQTENFDHFDLSLYSQKKDSRLGISPYENMEYILQNCQNFIHNFDTDFDNLLFYGSTGVGKTFLSNCIAKELLDGAHTVIYLSALSLMEILENHAFKRSDDEHDPDDMYAYILDCDLLIIDDLGTEMSNTFTNSQLFSCLNDRLLNRKSTIISTNLSLDDLQEIYSERIFSRLVSHYQVMLVIGDDIRIKKVIS